MSAPTESESDQMEDALTYLPRTTVVEYRTNQLIYSEELPADRLFLIIAGRVKVFMPREGGLEMVMGLYGAEDLFGEEALLYDFRKLHTQAIALERTTLMSWSRMEIEAQIERQPRLGLALIQLLTRRCVEFQERLRSEALDTVPKRVIGGLISLARHGTCTPDGSIRIPSLTHQTLAGYIGTSRELVLNCVNT